MHIVGEGVLYHLRRRNWTGHFITVRGVLLPHMQSEITDINIKHKSSTVLRIYSQAQRSQRCGDIVQTVQPDRPQCLCQRQWSCGDGV